MQKYKKYVSATYHIKTWTDKVIFLAMFVLVTAGTCLFVCLYCSSSSSTKKSIGNCQKKKNFKYFKFYTYLIAETKPYKPQRNQKLALGIQTYQILTNDVEVCISSFSSIFFAVPVLWLMLSKKRQSLV